MFPRARIDVLGVRGAEAVAAGTLGPCVVISPLLHLGVLVQDRLDSAKVQEWLDNNARIHALQQALPPHLWNPSSTSVRNLAGADKRACVPGRFSVYHFV